MADGDFTILTGRKSYLGDGPIILQGRLISSLQGFVAFHGGFMAHVMKNFVKVASTPEGRTTLYTVPSGRRAIVRTLLLSNGQPAAVDVFIWMAGIGVYEDLRIQPNAVHRDTGELHVLEPGETIEASAQAAGLNLTISGIEEILS